MEKRKLLTEGKFFHGFCLSVSKFVHVRKKVGGNMES